MRNGKYAVLIVEDQAMPAELFEHFVRSSEKYEVAASIASAALAEVYCMGGKIDLILMDVVTADGACGLDAAEKIKAKYPSVKIIIVTSMPECSYLKRAKKIGVEGFWYKEASKEPILSLMDRVMNGETIYPDALPPVKLGLAFSNEFTERELMILRDITGGFSNQEIAEKYGIAANTVKNHVANMLLKTGFRNRIELAVRAREAGIVIMERTEDDI